MEITTFKDHTCNQLKTVITLTDGATFESSKAELAAAIIAFSKLMEREASLRQIHLSRWDILRLLREEVEIRMEEPVDSGKAN